MRTRRMRAPPSAAVRPGRIQRWWLDRSVHSKGMVVVAVPLIALIAVTSAGLALQANEQQERHVALTASALTTSAQQVPADAVNAETSARGYAATGDPLFLKPYRASLTRLARDQAKLRAAAIAEGDSGAERTAAATTTKVLADMSRLHSAASAGVPAAAQLPARLTEQATMDTLRRQIAALVQGPTADNLARRAEITRLESVIGWVSIAGLVLGLLAGLTGVALFGSGISRRITRAVTNADRQGEGQPLAPMPAPDAGDELGHLQRSLIRADEILAGRTTQLISARDEAVTATQAKNTFLSSTSHELRTPLNAVLGFAQLLQLSDLSQEDQDAVGRILSAGQHLLALVNELIDIARIESGGFSLSVEPVAVQPVVEETCQLMAPLADDRSITLTQLCPPPGLAVKADRQRLRQILVNLLSNAIKYNRAGGTITVTCQADSSDQASLTVADTGPRDTGRWPGTHLRPVRAAGRRSDRHRGHRDRPAPGPGLRRGNARATHRRHHPGRRDGLHHHPAEGTGPSPVPGRRRGGAASADRAR